MQKNCHEFIAYENLVGGRRPGSVEKKGGAPAALATTDVSKAIPLVKRALKVLVDREVSPQLGLLKSTLLQLDSTFSERDYGVSTFRDFIEKVAQTGIVTLRHSGRSVLVELADGDRGADGGPAIAAFPPTQPAARPAVEAVAESAREAVPEDGRADHAAEPREAAAATQPAADSVEARQAIQHVQEIFQRAAQPPRWPMYVRQVKQYLRGADEGFDERKLGFGTIVELLRACQREGVFRLERDRQGVLRVFPGTDLQRPIAQPGTVTEPADVTEMPELSLGDAAGAGAPPVQGPEARAPETPAEPDVAEGVTIETEAAHEQEPGAEFAAEGESEGDRPRARATRARRTPRKTATGRPAVRKSTGAKATPRARKANG